MELDHRWIGLIVDFWENFVNTVSTIKGLHNLNWQDSTSHNAAEKYSLVWYPPSTFMDRFVQEMIHGYQTINVEMAGPCCSRIKGKDIAYMYNFTGKCEVARV